MAQPFVAEIRMFGFNFAPKGWAQCNGQLLPISQNTALFSLLGTNYGGDGKSNFGLPNLQGSAAVDAGQGPGLSDYVLGQTGGVQTVTLTTQEMPLHQHAVNASGNNADQNTPVGNVWATGRVGRAAVNLYSGAGGTNMNPTALSPAGNSQLHDNMPPYQVVNFCIAMQGIFPSRN